MLFEDPVDPALGVGRVDLEPRNDVLRSEKVCGWQMHSTGDLRRRIARTLIVSSAATYWTRLRRRRDFAAKLESGCELRERRPHRIMWLRRGFLHRHHSRAPAWTHTGRFFIARHRKHPLLDACRSLA